MVLKAIKTTCRAYDYNKIEKIIGTLICNTLKSQQQICKFLGILVHEKIFGLILKLVILLENLFCQGS